MSRLRAHNRRQETVPERRLAIVDRQNTKLPSWKLSRSRFSRKKPEISITKQNKEPVRGLTLVWGQRKAGLTPSAVQP